MTVEMQVSQVDGHGGGRMELSDATFGCGYNEPLIHQVVVAYQAGARAGTRAQKNRAAVSGGGAKPWRQKGTGRARAGTIRSPIFRGGGVAFPAGNQDFSHKVNRNMYRAAMRSILSELTRQGRITVVEQLSMEKPATAALRATLDALVSAAREGNTDKDARGNPGAAGTARLLVILAEPDRNLELSARNLIRVSMCLSGQIDPLNLVCNDHVLVTRDAVKRIDEALQ